MKIFTYSIIFLIILSLPLSRCNSRNLSELIENQDGPWRELTLNSGRYYLDGKVNIRNVDRFLLRGNNDTIVECVDNEINLKNSHWLSFHNVSEIKFEGITFQDCNKNIQLKDPPSNTKGYFIFKDCYSVRVNLCKFLNIRGINLLCYNTPELSVLDSVFQNKYNLSKAMLLFVNDTNKQSTSLEVRRSEFEGEEWTRGANNQKDHANFMVKCGSAISAFLSSHVNVSIQIVDNQFRGNKAAHGGAVCVWLQETVRRSNITIDRGNFIGGEADIRSDNEKYHERPGGGAIALFMYNAAPKLTLRNCNFTNNLGYRGGALYIDISLPTEAVEIQNCHFEGNKGELGGAVMITTSQIPNRVYLRSINNKFTGNRASELGGAILAMRVSIAMHEDNLIANNAVKYGDGGGLALVFSHILANGSFQIVNNTANRAGGGVYLSSQGKISMGRRESLLNISGNKAKMYGGGLYAYSLNYEYMFIENTLPEKERFRRACFLRGEWSTKIILQGNKVENNNTACSGNTAYTQLLGKCLTPDIIEGDLVMDEGECSLDTRENSFNLKIDSIITLTCNKSMFTTEDTTSLNILDFCKMEGSNVDPFTKGGDGFPLKMIHEFYKSHNNITEFHYIHPGYHTTLNVSSMDYFNNSVVTRANLSARIFSDGKKGHDIKSNPMQFNVYSDEHQSFSFLTNKSLPVKLKSLWYGLGVVCVKSIEGYTKIEKCIGIIMGECPPGFNQSRNECKCSKSPWYHCNKKNQIVANPGVYLVNEYSFNDPKIEMQHSKCLWFRCKCNLGSYGDACTFDPMQPDQQCYSGLKGPLCGECSNPNETLLHSPYLYNNCFKCTYPEVRIAGVIGILAIICFLIIFLKTNFFEDYLRSIIFYANILYVILSNSNSNSITPIVTYVLAGPVLVLNLLVTQAIPFCLYPHNKPIFITMFQMIVPSAVLFLFLGLQRLLIRYSSFSKREVPTQILSLLLLTYTDLSIHSFMVLDCPQIVNTRYWLYHGNTVCFNGWHLRATILSVCIIFILIAIPCFLTFIAYDNKRAHDYRFIENMTRNFKQKFRFWEIYKLALRLLISFLLSLLTNYFSSVILKIVVSIICFSNMIFNSLAEPAENNRSNYFESLCFFCLGLIAIPQINEYINYFAIIPFIVGFTAFILDKRLQLFRAKIKKIKERYGDEMTNKEKLKLIWNIWDTNDINTLNAL